MRMLGISSIEFCRVAHRTTKLDQIVQRFITLAVFRGGPLTMDQSKLISSTDCTTTRPVVDKILSRREVRIAFPVAWFFK